MLARREPELLGKLGEKPLGLLVFLAFTGVRDVAGHEHEVRCEPLPFQLLHLAQQGLQRRAPVPALGFLEMQIGEMQPAHVPSRRGPVGGFLERTFRAHDGPEVRRIDFRQIEEPRRARQHEQGWTLRTEPAPVLVEGREGGSPVGLVERVLLQPDHGPRLRHRKLGREGVKPVLLESSVRF